MRLAFFVRPGPRIGIEIGGGGSTPTIYRRWRSKLPLVVETFSLVQALEEVDTGDLVSDLKQMLRAYLELFNTTPLGTVLPSLAGERRHQALSKLLDPVLRERRRPLVRALERAVARGELPADLDLALRRHDVKRRSPSPRIPSISARSNLSVGGDGYR